jgi:phenylacetate-CoA ligase
MITRARYLRQMLRNETRDPQRLHAAQLDALERLVRHAGTHVPFYRDLYRTHGIDVARFDGRRDVLNLPLIDKHQLRTAGSQAQSQEDAPAAAGVKISTSGSTGEPFVFTIDRDYDQWRKAQYLRPYLRAGRRFTHKVLRLTAFPVSRRSLFSKLGLLREWQFGCATPAAELHSHWCRLAPDVLQGYPSALRTLAIFCLETGKPLEPAPRMVCSDSELLMPDTRMLLQKAFGTAVIDIFGTYETDNIAWQCGRSEGYHIATDCVLLEIIRNGRPAEVGEQGEIVVTVLSNRRSPFIRYNLHDLAQFAPQRCVCGSPFPLLTRLVGRADDLIVLEDGSSRTSMDVLGRLDRYTDLVHHYQLRQLGTQRFELLIVPARRVADADAANLIAAVRQSLPSAAVELKLVDSIAPQKSGKRLAFVRA